MVIIVSKNNRNAEKVRRSTKDEAYLQRYIHDKPDTIPVYEIDENKQLLVAAREFQTNSDPIDVRDPVTGPYDV